MGSNVHWDEFQEVEASALLESAFPASDRAPGRLSVGEPQIRTPGWDSGAIRAEGIVGQEERDCLYRAPAACRCWVLRHPVSKHVSPSQMRIASASDGLHPQLEGGTMGLTPWPACPSAASG